MNSIPARVDNVEEILMVVPTPNGDVNPMVLAAAHLAVVAHSPATVLAARNVHLVSCRVARNHAVSFCVPSMHPW